MTDRWRMVDSLFERALELPHSEREAFVRSAAGDDSYVRSDVLGLLRSMETMGDFLEDGLPDSPSSILEDLAGSGPTAESLLGQVVGPFKLVEVLGSGGTSTVYRGARTDPSFEQSVALKIFRTDRAPSDLAERVRSERQILASLAHPDLATLFDAGVTDEGRPYLVVELVRGRPITTFADAETLSVEERIELFMRVAGAVAYAHRNLVVHQDLKPSNILVTDEGHVKLLDFGIAKLMSGSGPQAGEKSDQSQRWMTPRYASPEQIEGGPVTTATDVHALGLLLFELLCGGSPFAGVDDGSTDPKRAVSQRDATAPSTAVRARKGAGDSAATASLRHSTQARLIETLEGDLDAIVLKALRKSPTERYPTADALIDDIRRYQDRLPVEAREPTATYQLSKFASRHRFGVAATIGVIVMLTVGTVALSIERGRTIRERDRANEAAATATAQAEKAQAVVAFLGDVFRGRDPSQAPSDTITALQLVKWGESRLEKEFSDQPDVMTELLEILGGAYMNLGLPQRAQPLLQRSVALRRATYGDLSQQTADGLIRLANHHILFRSFDESLPLASEALEILLELHGANSFELLPGLSALASGLREVGRADSSIVLTRRAVRLSTEAGQFGTPEHTARTLRLAFMLRGDGKLDEAETLYREGIALLRADPSHQPVALSQHLNNLGYLMRLRQDYKGADSLYHEAFDISVDLYGRDHPSTILLASNWAGALMNNGQSEPALDLLRANVESTRLQFGPKHWRVGAALSGLGFAHIQASNDRSSEGGSSSGRSSWGTSSLPAPAEVDPKRYAAAEERLREAVAVYETSLGVDHEWTVFGRAHVDVLDLAVNAGRSRAALDRVYAMSTAWTAAGNLTSSGLDLIKRVVRLLDLVGLDDEAERFRAFVP